MLTIPTGFKSSGHVLCAMVSYANWLNFYLETQKEDNHTHMIIRYCSIILTIYQLYCLCFTCFIFHDHSEVLHGIANALVVNLLTF